MAGQDPAPGGRGPAPATLPLHHYSHIPCHQARVRTPWQAKILRSAGEGLRLPLAGGAAQRLVDDARNGLAAGVLDAPPAGGQLADAALFIDQSAQQLGPVAATKWGGWG